MKKSLTVFLTATLVLGAFAQNSFNQQELQNIRNRVFNDPQFIERFVGSYAPLEALEPEFTEEEKLRLKEEVLTIIQGPQPILAVPALREMASVPNSSAQIDYLLGTILFQEGRVNEAIPAYEAAIRKFPNYRRAIKNLAILYVQSGRLDQALGPLSKSIELGDVSGLAYGILGVIYLEKEDFISAESAYRSAILFEPDKKEWKMGLLKTLMSQERYSDANSLLSTLLQEDPNNADLWKFQANNFLGLEKPLEAAKNLELVVRMGQANTDSLELLGNIYMNQQLYPLAHDVYQRVIQSGGAQFDTLFNSAAVLASVGSFTESLDLIERIRTRYGDQLSKENNLQLMTLEASSLRSTGDLDAAVEILQEVVLEDPTNGQALIELGLYFRTQYNNSDDVADAQKAISYFEQAANIDETAPDALVQHAQMLVSQRRYRDAVRLLKRAQELRYENYVEDFLQRVERAARQS